MCHTVRTPIYPKCQLLGRCVTLSGRSSVKASSVRTIRTFRLDAHQCLKASNSSRLDPSECNGKSSVRSLEFEKNPAFKCIRTSFSVWQAGFCLKTQLWKDGWNRLDDVWSRPDDVLHKASHAYKVQPSRLLSVFMVRTIKHHIWKLHAPVQPSRHQPLGSRRSKPYYGNYVQPKCNHQFARTTSSRCSLVMEAFSATLERKL